MKKTLLIVSMSVLATSAFALTASDDASNYGGGWTSGSNGGSGFNDWFFETDGDDIAEIADSTTGAGNVNTTAGAFRMASSGDLDVFRSFTTLQAGDVLSFDVTLNFRNPGSKGFDLRRNSGDGVFNFNVAGDEYFFGGTNLSVDEGWDYVTNGVYSMEFEFVTETIMNAKIIRNSATFGVEQYQIPNVALSGGVDNFKFYVSGNSSNSEQQSLYFNNLQVVPEPNAYALIAGALALLCVATRRRG